MNDTTPAISIVSACYNHGKYIHEMLESVFAQSFKSYEVIIVNDGSTDSTREILDSICDERVTVIHIENRGPSFARNAGIARAKGALVYNLDADDRIAPELLEKAYNVFSSDTSIGIVSSEICFFGARHGRFKLEPYSLANMLKDNVIGHAFFRKKDWELVGGYSEDFIYGLEDYDLYLSLIELGRGFHKIPEELMYYRKYRRSWLCRSGGRLISREKLLYSHLKIFERHKNLYEKEPDRHQFFLELQKRTENESSIEKALKGLYHVIKNWRLLLSLE